MRYLPTALLAAKAAWSMYCVKTSVDFITKGLPIPYNPSSSNGLVVVLAPVLHEGDRVASFISHWANWLDQYGMIHLCILTTEREKLEVGSSPTRDAIASSTTFSQLLSEGRASLLHYPTQNRTYGEQLAWGLEQLQQAPYDDTTHVYVTNIDSLITKTGAEEIVALAASGVAVAQQSTVFFRNFENLGRVAAAEALYQTRWTLEREYFRYLVGSEAISWIPKAVARIWYQHTVGHGLLIALSTLDQIGGLPTPLHGLEDSALGVTLRSTGLAVRPMVSLACAEAPGDIRELLRQRSTWVRGPLCAAEYASSARGRMLALQGSYDGLKWVFGVPILMLGIWRNRPTKAVVIALLSLLELYGTALLTVRGLNHPNINTVCAPSREATNRALRCYPAAALSYAAGGLLGAISLVAELAKGSRFQQGQTRHLK